MDPPLVPQQVFASRYVLEREIGHEGMVTVYLARDLRHDRPVTLKVFRRESTATIDPQRFLREIEIGARLDHPNILALQDCGESDGRLFYVTASVEGESLRQKLSRERQLPLADTINIISAVANALTHAHGHGIVHRSLKPENILLSAGESTDASVHPLVADFRIASTVPPTGTPSYMSPEQAAGGDIDGRSDIYALGCVAYEMLAGNPPFTGSTDQAILARHSVDPVPALRTVRSTVPLGVERAITRALAKVPAARFDTASEFAQALAAGHIPRRIPHRAGLAPMAGAAFTVAAVTAAIWLRGSEPPVLPSAARIAVLPFLSASNDTALDRLGRDLAVTVSTSLDGVGGIETTDRATIAAATADRATPSPAEATALARRLGARSVLGGTLARDGPEVRIALELHDTEADTSVVRGVTVTGPSDSLRALTDSVVWALLRHVWRRGEPPTPSLTALTTQSLPALRAFLDGERNVELNRWDEAALAYRSAMEADSTFWLAYFRYSLAQYWREEPIDAEVALALFRHREVFPERDRLLVEAWVAKDTLSVYLERLEAVTRRFPDYWPGWFMLGDRLTHAGALLGHDWRHAQDALSRAVALNPRLRPAWVHLWLNAVGKDTVESGRVAARILELRRNVPDTPERAHNRLVMRLSLAAQRTNGVITPGLRALIDTMARHNWELHKDAPENTEAWAWSPHLNAGYPAAQIEFNRQSVRLWLDGTAAAAQLRGIAWSWAVRGSWDSALVTMREALAMNTEPGAEGEGELLPLDDYGLAALGAWLDAVEPSEILRRRPAAVDAIQRLDDESRKAHGRWMLAWLDGVSAFARRDRAALGRARRDSRNSGHPLAEFLDRSLATYGRAMAGDRAGAGRELAALQWSCLVGDCGPRLAIMAHIATDRLAAATWLLESGDTTQASRLLVWYESVENGWDSSFNWVMTGPAYLMRARIAEAQGDARSAADHYHQFLRRYDSPMPAQRHLVDEARAGLVRLSGRKDPPDR